MLNNSLTLLWCSNDAYIYVLKYIHKPVGIQRNEVLMNRQQPIAASVDVVEVIKPR